MSAFHSKREVEETSPPLPPCCVCRQEAPSVVWGFDLCREHEAAWRVQAVPPAEHYVAHAVTHDALCAAWTAATRTWLAWALRRAS